MKILYIIQVLLLTIVVSTAVWLAVTVVIFRFRHPWATETEVFLYLPEAFTLQRVERPTY